MKPLRSRLLPLVLTLFFASESVESLAVDSNQERPNVVVIFIDDMGYGDIGPFGNTVNQTPNLDRMAEEGNTLRQFYVANTACTPSRSALLTGSYAHRIGMDGMVVFPGQDRGLNPDEFTIAEMLKEQGYITGCFGKWHLGDQEPFLPLAQGFDEYFGIPYSNDMWPGNKRGNPVTNRGPYEPLPVIRQNEAVAYVADGADQALLCEVVTDEAVKFIKAHRDEPFFCFVPHAYVHNPRFARPEILARAEGDPNRANVEEVDTSVGRILDTLRELKIDKRTLVLFTSDNGGAGGMSMGPLRGGKGGPKYEGHMRVPTVAWWPGTIPAGVETTEIGVTTDLLPSFAKLTGAKIPTDRVLDGKDVLDLLLARDGAKSPHDLHYYEVDGIRRGKWKLVNVVKKGKKVSELYDLEKDLAERNDLAADYPELVAELNELLTRHAKSIAADVRPAAFVENAKPILTETGDLPKLRELMGMPNVIAGNEAPKKGEVKPSAPKAPAKANKAASDRSAANRPDILFIAIDDMNDWTTLFDENNPIQTPNLERLAARGTFFKRAYCASAGCNPSRTAIMTGYRPTTSGVYANPQAWREKIPDAISLPEYFAEHGDYQTKGAGKIYHHGRTGAEPEGRPSFQEFFKKLPIRGPGKDMNYNGYRKSDRVPLASLAFDWGIHDQKMIDVDMCEWVEARLGERRQSPLFLAAGIFNPHLPFYAPADTFERYPDGEVAMPPMPEGDLDDVGRVGIRMTDKEAFVFDNTSAAEPGSPKSLERMVQCYQAAADYADQMVGRLLDKLDETGRADNTVIVLWSDHGYHLGDKECGVKFTLWEKATRVPFIIVAPGIGEPGSVCETPVSLVDIYPTLVDLAGLPLKEDNDGLSLVPLLKNPNGKWDRPVLMTEGPGNHAIRTRDFRYIRYHDGFEELYADADPWNHDNLASDPKYADILASHRQHLPEREAPGVPERYQTIDENAWRRKPPAGPTKPRGSTAKPDLGAFDARSREIDH